MFPDVLDNIQKAASKVRQLPTDIIDGLEQAVTDAETAYITSLVLRRLPDESYYGLWRSGINAFSLGDLSKELSPILNDNDKNRLWKIRVRVTEMENKDFNLKRIINNYYTDLIKTEVSNSSNKKKGYFSDFRFESNQYSLTIIKATYNEKKHNPWNPRIARAIEGTPYEAEYRKPYYVKHEAPLYVLWWRPRRFVSYSWWRRLGTVESVTPPWEWFNLGKLAFSLGKAITKSVVSHALKKVSNVRLASALSKQLKTNPKGLSKRLSNRGVDARAVERNTYRVKPSDRGTLPKPGQSRASISKEIDDLGTELKAVQKAKRQAWAKRQDAKAAHKKSFRDPKKQELVNKHRELIEREKELLRRQRALTKKLKKAKGIEPRPSWLQREKEIESLFGKVFGKNNVFVKPKVAVLGKNKGHVPAHLKRNNAMSRADRHKAGLSSREVTPELLVKVNAKKYVMIDAKGETLLGRHAQNLVYRQMQKDGKAMVVHAGKDGAKVGTVVHGQVLKVGPKQLAKLKAAKSRTELIKIVDDLLREQKSLYGNP